MFKNLSRQYLSSCNLVKHYQNANQEIMGKHIYVHPDIFPKFAVVEDDLREIHASTRVYAYTVVEIYRKAMRAKGLKYVPIGTFLGMKAWERFLRVFNSQTIDLSVSDDRERMLYDELLVARVYIQRNTDENGNVVRFKSVVDEMRKLLYEDWLAAYDANRGRPVTEALEMLASEYRVKSATSYADIVTAINNAR